MGDSANKLDECIEIIADIKMAINKLDFDSFLTKHQTKERGYLLKKSM